jgi:hypothetical protein
MWLLPNINILTPIFKHMWAKWENVIICKRMAEQGSPLIKTMEKVSKAFKHYTCLTPRNA